MPDIKSIQQARAELPGSVITSGKVADPVINHLTALSGSLVQRQRVGSVTTLGIAVVFSPAFSGTPVVICRMINAAPGSYIAGMRTVHSTGGTIALSATGTLPVNVIAFDPTR